MCECKICNRIFKTMDPIGPHLSRIHNTSIKEYYDTFIKKPGEGICPICGKETIFLSLTKGYQKHCSSKCAGQDEFTLSIRRQTCLERYGTDSVASNDCVIRQETNRHYYEKTGYHHPWENPDVIEKRKQNNLKKFGFINPMQNPEIRKKSRSKYFYDNRYFDSSWEIAYYIWLKDNAIDFDFHPNDSFEYITSDGKVHKYFPDFKVGDEYIEIKGDHLYEKHSMSMPPEKIECMQTNGIKILRSAEIKPILNYICSKYGKSYVKKFKL